MTMARSMAVRVALPSVLLSVPLGAQAVRAPNVVQRIPLARGVVISQAEQGVGGERESVTEIEDASALASATAGATARSTRTATRCSGTPPAS